MELAMMDFKQGRHPSHPPAPADLDLPEYIRQDLAARPLPAGTRRVYNKAFKMPEGARGH